RCRRHRCRCASSRDEPAVAVGGDRRGVAPGRVAPAAAAARFDHQAVAGADFEAGLLGADRPRLAVAGIKHIAVRPAVLAAKDAAGAVHYPVAGSVGQSRLGGLDHHLDDPARTAAVLPGAARIGAELVFLEEQRKARLGHFEAAELDAAGGLPLAAAGPAVARRRGAAARPRLKEMPDEGTVAPARILALDGDAEAPPPAGHCPLRAGRRQRLDDRLDDLLAAMV